MTVGNNKKEFIFDTRYADFVSLFQAFFAFLFYLISENEIKKSSTKWKITNTTFYKWLFINNTRVKKSCLNNERTNGASFCNCRLTSREKSSWVIRSRETFDEVLLLIIFTRWLERKIISVQRILKFYCFWKWKGIPKLAYVLALFPVF